MEYPWYEEVKLSDEISQGDIIIKCYIPIPGEELFDFFSEEDGQIEFDSPVDVKIADVIILSQACDIMHDKIDSIIACPVWTLKTLISENSYFAGSDARESLRQGKEPSYHLLNEYPSLDLELSVVDFHRIYSLPKNYLKKITGSIEKRLRLLPPYREHLSQAFARYFMRVGLPIDIDKNKVKECRVN